MVKVIGGLFGEANPLSYIYRVNKLKNKIMNRNEQQMYSDITSIRKSLEKIANVLEHMNHDSYLAKQEIPKFQDIPGFEGTLDALDNLYVPKDKYETDGTSVGNGKYEDENDIPCKIDGIINDSDYDVRVDAKYYYENLECNDLGNPEAYKFRTKKDCILDYVTNVFGSYGARYTDVIKFAYYLGAPNAPKYASENRGYYSCAFSPRMDGHLIQGGKDFLVKGINKNGKERYFALSFVESATAYWKRIG